MKTTQNSTANLADYTSFKLGGPVKNMFLPKNSDDLVRFLRNNSLKPVHVLGYGCNVLISDDGLDGVTVVNRQGNYTIVGTEIIADSGVLWDDIVRLAVEKDLWGIELLSEIPGSLGGAVFINISAYGQSISSVIKWVDAWDLKTQKLVRFAKDDMTWDYKKSIFQENRNLIIIRACLSLSDHALEDLTYQKALDIALELNLDKEVLLDRRKIITEARERAGSIWHHDQKYEPRTVGSFFRNPVVRDDKVEQIIKYDETKKTKDEVLKMNKVHGGKSSRISAAHVMLACGYERGQTWENRVKLNEKNLLKIEAINDATAQDVFDVALEIQKSCIKKLDIKLEPEAQFIGSFKKQKELI
jgi:UDP-N-acetylmuramate dehydrogenase